MIKIFVAAQKFSVEPIHIYLSIYVTKTAEVIFEQFIFLLEITFQPKQYFFLTFSAPCIQNLNLSVHLLVKFVFAWG